VLVLVAFTTAPLPLPTDRAAGALALVLLCIAVFLVKMIWARKQFFRRVSQYVRKLREGWAPPPERRYSVVAHLPLPHDPTDVNSPTSAPVSPTAATSVNQTQTVSVAS